MKPASVCSESGCSTPGTGESRPAPQGAAMRQLTSSALVVMTSACVQTSAPQKGVSGAPRLSET